jgi:hypothetical protein
VLPIQRKLALLAGSTIVDNIESSNSRENGSKKTLPSFQTPNFLGEHARIRGVSFALLTQVLKGKRLTPKQSEKVSRRNPPMLKQKR